MMEAKNYINTILLFLVIFLIYHIIVWNTLTYKFFNGNNEIYIGDLCRMSYLNTLITERKNEQTLEKKHFTYDETLSEIDLITIGDSFSNGNAKGPNRYYQDFIATYNELNVLNIQPSPKGFIETILILNKSGYLDKLKPKYILIESVERSSIGRLSKPIDWNIEEDEAHITNLILTTYKSGDSTPIPFINAANYNALIYNVFYKYDDNAFVSKAYLANLANNFFSCKDSNKLLFYYEDITHISMSNKKSVLKLNENLNKLAKILNNKGIKLYFMAAVDKYNLYSDYIVNNPYPKSIFFEELRKYKKDYIFIDTKLILAKLLRNGIKDVYYSDDTHWSSIGSSEIAKNINF